MTVAELIAILSRLDPELPVEIAMRMEYQEPVTERMVTVEEYDGRRYVCINDCP